MIDTPAAADVASSKPGAITGYTLDQALVVTSVRRQKARGGAA